MSAAGSTVHNYFNNTYGQRHPFSYLNPILSPQGVLHFIERNKGTIFQVMRQAEGLDVLLQPWRHLALVPPEVVAEQLVL